ncbi:hypothetical protein HYN59_13160 [Flavobacterium album]|uniref:Uncharacterized protein n=1 Tax=Flavobacterium album TaxID=2175091 RepID=A0A2S1R010_9FLAO|nr:GldM family protein [Flavobacterium album]AWH85998.1 hypothetical protein HYN59_13160 [Flavobacterium album]
MKLTILLLMFLPLTAVSQTTQNISVVSAERLNVVYRGIDNPVKIAVPGARSFTATAPGMRETEIPGNYIINPGSGLEVNVIIEAVMNDDSIIKEVKSFRIKGLHRPMATINGYNSTDDTAGLSKKELANAIIGLDMGDFLFETNFNVKSFTVSFPEKKNMEPIEIEGNKMNQKAIEAINKLRSGDFVLISNIRFLDSSPTTCFPYLASIIVEIDEKPHKLITE